MAVYVVNSKKVLRGRRVSDKVVVRAGGKILEVVTRAEADRVKNTLLGRTPIIMTPELRAVRERNLRRNRERAAKSEG